MGAQAITELLSTLLIISIIILFGLIIAFVILSIKQRMPEKKDEPEEIKDKETKKLPSNVVQAKNYTTENIKKFMDFTEIKDNMILQKDGKRFVMVMKCQGINYDLMSAIEQAGVEQGFSQFLNSLTKPIQIHIQARKVNLESSIVDYRKRLQRMESNFYKARMQYESAQKLRYSNEKAFKNVELEYTRQRNLYEYTQDLIANTEKMSLNQNILTKNYYIAISYYPENKDGLFQKEEVIELAFAELYTSAQAILRTLAVCGVTGKVLDSVELAELLYVAYNRDTSEIYQIDEAIRLGYDALYTTAPDVIDKKIMELDKIIDQKANDLALDTMNKIISKTQKEKDLEYREQEMDFLIQELAKSIIKENKNSLSEEIIEKSLEELENKQEEKKQEKKKRVKKGA